MTSHIDSDTGTDTGMPPTATLQALAAAGDQPGWRVLDTARTQQFTGEIAFQSQPSISVYFDGGMAYHAVRAGDPSLCTRLVDAGVVEPAQVERGVIRVGNVENLGRLFDRDPSIDRDAVTVVLELATDDVVADIANTVSGPFALTAYRHHVSGVHRWFVSPGGSDGQPAQLTPVGEVAQIDGSVTGDLPGLGAAVAPVDDDIRIEWDQPIPNEPESAPAIFAIDDDLLSQLIGSADTSASMDAPTRPPALVEEAPQPTVAATPAPSAADLDHDIEAPGQDVAATATAMPVNDDFQILWPDGSEQQLNDIDISPMDDSMNATVDAAEALVAEALAAETSVADAPVAEALAAEAPVADAPVAEALVAEAPVTETPVAEATPVSEPDTPPVLSLISIDDLALAAAVDDGVVDAPEPEEAQAPTGLTFEMPSLALTVDNVPDDQQPEEVVDAVRRALEAIEAASAGPTQLPSVGVGSLPAFQPTEPLEFDVIDPLAHEAGAATTTTPSSTSSTTAEHELSALESVLPFEETDAAAAVAATAPAPAGFGGFAAPTMNDSAEAVYARTAAVEQPSAAPASGVASVVFVDEDPDESDDRSGALKRLIGSLRRK